MAIKAKQTALPKIAVFPKDGDFHYNAFAFKLNEVIATIDDKKGSSAGLLTFAPYSNWFSDNAAEKVNAIHAAWKLIDTAYVVPALLSPQADKHNTNIDDDLRKLVASIAVKS